MWPSQGPLSPPSLNEPLTFPCLLFLLRPKSESGQAENRLRPPTPPFLPPERKRREENPWKLSLRSRKGPYTTLTMLYIVHRAIARERRVYKNALPRWQKFSLPSFVQIPSASEVDRRRRPNCSPTSLPSSSFLLSERPSPPPFPSFQCGRKARVEKRPI